MDVLKIVSIVAGVVWLLATIAISLYYLWPYLRKWFTTNKVAPITNKTTATPPILPPKEVPTLPGSLSKTWPRASKQYKMNVMKYDAAEMFTAVEESTEDEYIEARRINQKAVAEASKPSTIVKLLRIIKKTKKNKAEAAVIPLKYDSAMRKISEVESLHTKPVIAGSMTLSAKQLSEILPDSVKPTEASKPSTIVKLLRVIKKRKKNKVAPDSKIVHVV